MAPTIWKPTTLYLKGRFQWNKRTAEGLKRSVQLFEQAHRRRSGFLHWAMRGLSDAYSLLADYGLVKPADIIPAGGNRQPRKALENRSDTSRSATHPSG